MKKLILLLLFIPLFSFGQEVIEDNYNPYSVIIDDIIIEEYNNYIFTKSQFREIKLDLKNLIKIGVKYPDISKSPFSSEPKFQIESFSINSKKNNIKWDVKGNSFSEQEKTNVDDLEIGTYLLKLENVKELTKNYFEDKKFSFFIDLIPNYDIIENGYSPYNYLYGESIINTVDDNDIVIKNSNISDTVVILIDKINQRVVRNVFINKGTEFTMLDIPDGNYYIKWYSGNYWSSNLMLNNNIKGGFQTDVSITKYSENETLELFGRKIITLTLYNVSDGKVKTEEITLNEFF